jgi:excisionase family DNA binding protein
MQEEPMNVQSQAAQWSDLPLVLTTTEVAGVLRLQRQTVTRMLVAGRLAGIKAGKDWRIARVEVERFMGLPHEQPSTGTAALQPAADACADAEMWANDPMTKLVGAFAGGPADLSSRHHEYYAEALAAEAGA